MQQIENLEQATRGRSSNKLWFQYRSGRITASKFKAVSNSNLSMPSQTLIKQICYPEAYKFSTSSTRYKGIAVCNIHICIFLCFIKMGLRA